MKRKVWISVIAMTILVLCFAAIQLIIFGEYHLWAFKRADAETRTGSSMSFIYRLMGTSAEGQMKYHLARLVELGVIEHKRFVAFFANPIKGKAYR